LPSPGLWLGLDDGSFWECGPVLVGVSGLSGLAGLDAQLGSVLQEFLGSSAAHGFISTTGESVSVSSGSWGLNSLGVHGWESAEGTGDNLGIVCVLGRGDECSPGIRGGDSQLLGGLCFSVTFTLACDECGRGGHDSGVESTLSSSLGTCGTGHGTLVDLESGGSISSTVYEERLVEFCIPDGLGGEDNSGIGGVLQGGGGGLKGCLGVLVPGGVCVEILLDRNSCLEW
jgi:hypothetical protein